MSKLSGVCQFNLQPVSPPDRARVEAALGTRGYASAQQHSEPGLLMGWAAGCELPRGPGLVESPEGSVCAWDGRLDNRDSLLPMTDLPPRSADSAVVLALYHSRGEEGLGDVVGDWSLAIWDAPRRTIVLASDFAGIRPLYYHRSAAGVWWSSCLADLVRWTGITALDDLYAAGFLAHGSAPNRTPYAGISTVPPGHAVSISRDKITTRPFWNLPVHHEIRYRDERGYEEHLLDLFHESVEARISGGGPVCAELSGGLDSSSVVSMAHRISQETPCAGPDLHTFSYTHRDCPDEKYFLEVERACNLSGCHLELHQYPPAAAGQAGAAPAWWQPRFEELARRVAAIGAGVFLTGQFGDCVMGNTNDDSDQVAEWIARGHYWRAGREAYGWARAMQVPIYPILWRGIREAYSSWAPSANPQAGVGAIRPSTENSLAGPLGARLQAYERERLAASPWCHAPPGRRQRFRAVDQVLQSRSLAAPEALQHISFAHPFAHRPLVEFMLAIPPRLVCGPNQPRRLMRRAFAGLLPPLVLNRKSKAAYTDIYVGALRPLAAEILKNRGEIQIVERGFADRQSLTGRLEKFTQGLECNESQLRQMILFEFWLRHRSAPETEPRPKGALAFS